MDTARVVEVLHDRGLTKSPRWLLGSGFIIRTGVVLTAAHNLGDSEDEVGPEGTTVRLLNGRELPAAEVLGRDSELDLAVLVVPGITGTPVQFAGIDRATIGVLPDVMAVGFPNYKYAPHKPPAQKRQPAQPVGIVPTAENANGAHLVLKLSAGEPGPVLPGQGSPWAGLSGAAVFCGEALLGVAVEHHAAEGQGALTFVPFSAIVELPVDKQVRLTTALGIPDISSLPVANAKTIEPAFDEKLVSLLEEIRALERQGLLGPSDAKSLRVTAFKKAKGL